MIKLDEQDRKIVEELQEDGRLSNVEIAKRVNLSHSSCSRRISRLEKDGVIVGYRAQTDRLKMGYTVRAFLGVIRDTAVSWEQLSWELAQIDGVVSVYVVSGEVDIMLEVVARDMQHYSDVVMKGLARTPGVSATRSTFVLEEVKSIY